MDTSALLQELERLFTLRDFGRARTLLEAASVMDDPQMAFRHALLCLELGDHAAARSSLDAALHASPELLPARQKRAALLCQLDDLDGALRDFQAIVQHDAHDAVALANIGIIHLRRQEHASALHALERASRLRPGDLHVQQSLANALSGCGQHAPALALFAHLRQHAPTNTALASDHALALLAAGHVDQAHTLYADLVATAPGDQWALAGHYMTSTLRDPAAAARLMDYALLLGPADASHLLTPELHAAVLALPDLRWEPAGKSTAQGQQSTLLDLSEASPFHGFGQAVAAILQARLHSLQAYAGTAGITPWLRALPQRWRLQAWATVLHGSGGQQFPHIHPAGWLSGVFYLDAGDGAAGEGDLVFGHPPAAMTHPLPVHAHRHTPREGAILTFPSYFLHHTTPYHGRRPRISLAFDLLPGER